MNSPSSHLGCRMLGGTIRVLLAEALFPLTGIITATLICGLAYALAALWPAPGFLLLLKLPAIGLVILLAFLLLGQFSAGEMALARSMLRWQTAPGQNPREV